MKKFGKGLLTMLAVIVGIPLVIMLLLAILGAIGIFAIAPGVVLAIIVVLLIISIPGILVGIHVGKKK